MPPFARETFLDGCGAARVNPKAPPVVLFPDTFNDFLHPESCEAAVEVLESAGFRVVVPDRLAVLRAPALRLRDARHREALLGAIWPCSPVDP